MDIIKLLTDEFKIKEVYVKNVIELIDNDNTIPFIARYRKEMTGSLSDNILRDFHKRLLYLRSLEKRKEEITNAITELDKMTDEIALSLENAQTLSELEDIYRPFKQKKRTRALIAKEKGLEPLSAFIFTLSDAQILEKAKDFISEDKGVASQEDAINGAKDIVAEIISDDAYIRGRLRRLYERKSVLYSKAQDEEKDSVYTMYYDYNEPVYRIPSHRILAVNRGEAEEFLKVTVEVDELQAIEIIKQKYCKKSNSETLCSAITDSYKRLISPSIEREIRNMLTEKAFEGAISVFADNLDSVIMQPPVKGRVCMGFDPAYRTGCKIAVVDQNGKVLDTTVVYPTPPQNKEKEAEETLLKLIKKHNITLISIGNGTASKESEIFVSNMIKNNNLKVEYMVVNEAGASVYSASELASKEFPEYDVSLRSAISIARRLQDPMAELVKIEPKAIGVGQYQHDLPQTLLSDTLKGVVENCVNRVGVDLNTASAPLLSYISGLNISVAKNIVTYREENGAFSSREQLKKVPRLGPKAFEQCAGFLRIPESDNILDNTAVHPESYKTATALLKAFRYTNEDVKNNKLSSLEEKANEKGISEIATSLNTGIPTLKDIISELIKPGRDIRDSLPQPLLRTDIMSIEDLTVGMELTGTVRNVIDFGVFVDIGVHRDGLVHISQICEKRINHPSEVLKVGDIVKVKVLEADVKKNKISLTMK